MNLATVVTLSVLAAVTSMAAETETGIRVRSIRVLAADPEAVATFYEKAFGMSETRRAANSATFKEIIINSGATPEKAKAATSSPIVIATRPKDAPAGAMASLILEVPNLDRAIESAKASGGTLMRPAAKSGEGLSYAFVNLLWPSRRGHSWGMKMALLPGKLVQRTSEDRRSLWRVNPVLSTWSGWRIWTPKWCR